MDRYSTFWLRVGAGFIDGLVLAPISIADSYMSRPERGTIVLICWAIVSSSAFYIYSVVMHARSGQTVGKRVMGVRVVNVEETRIPTLRQAILRDIADIALDVLGLSYSIYLISTHHYTPALLQASLFLNIVGYANLGWFILEMATMLTNSKRRAFHDLIAGTVVIRTGYYSVEEGLQLNETGARP